MKFARLMMILLLCSSGTLKAQMSSNERPIEMSTAQLHLPAALPGSIYASACENGCPPVSLKIDANTQFVVGRKPSTLAEMRKLAANPNLNVTIFYDARTLVIGRIVANDRGR